MTRLRTAGPLLAAVGLAVLAAVSVRAAGCDDPGYVEVLPDGAYVLVGGCVDPDDLVVSPPVTVPPSDGDRAPVPARS